MVEAASWGWVGIACDLSSCFVPLVSLVGPEYD